MNRQCRICLDTDDPYSMVAPCNCRGSAEFIHKTCLEEYLRHFPDGVCRVCRENMLSADTYIIFTQVLLFCWLMGLLGMSHIPSHTKILYISMTLALLTFMGVRKLASYPVMFLIFGMTFLVNFVYVADLIKLVIILGCLTGTATIVYYIPPQHVFMIALIGILTLYGTLLTLFIATRTDVYMSAYFVGFIGLGWYTCVRLRPPFN